MNATVTGVKMAIAIRDTLDDLLNGPVSVTAGSVDDLPSKIREGLHHRVPIRLRGDNLAALKSIVKEVTSWRSRHYAIRSGWIRDMVMTEDIVVVHEKGTWLVSDALTKVLDRVKLADARKRLGMLIL